MSETSATTLSPLLAACAGRHWLSSEIFAPDRPELDSVTGDARALAGAGAEVLFVPDAPGGRPGIDSVVMAAAIRSALGIATVPHLNCRDRNAVALEGSFLAAAALGLRGIKAVTGDPVRAAGVYEFRSGDLVRGIRSWSSRLATPMTLVVGHRLGGADPVAAEDRLRAKIESGADLVVLTPTLSASAIHGMLERIRTPRIPVIPSVSLVTSAEVLRNLVSGPSGFEAPPDLEGLLASAADGAAALDIAIAAALDFVHALAPVASGFHVVPPFAKVAPVLPLLSGIRRILRNTPSRA